MDTKTRPKCGPTEFEANGEKTLVFIVLKKPHPTRSSATGRFTSAMSSATRT
jgi:hypothetical protein